MGWSVTFKPTEEAISKIKPWNYGKTEYNNKSSEHIEDCKLEILLYCMSEHDRKEIVNVISDLRFKLRYLEMSLYDDYKKSIYEEWLRDGEITFYGWNFSHEEPDMDEKDIYDIYLGYLALKSIVVKTPNYFTKNEDFFTKSHDIKEDIEGFIESMNDVFAYRIMDMFKDFREKDDEDEEYENETKGTFDNGDLFETTDEPETQDNKEETAIKDDELQ